MRRIDFTNTQVASSGTARDINRGVVLNFIRRRQPISRADLARVSGLQRSTVSLITEQLIRERWVVNGPLDGFRAVVVQLSCASMSAGQFLSPTSVRQLLPWPSPM